YAFDVPAGMKAELSAPSHEYCINIFFYRPDRSLIQARDCHYYGATPYDTIYATITTAGRYYVRVSHADDIETPGDEGRVYLYKIRLARYESPKPGLGNPMTLFTDDLDEATAMVATRNGDMIVADWTDGTQRLKRVTPNGQVTVLASDVHPNGQIAVDAFGDLLVPSEDEGGVVWRYNLQTGARTVFTGPPSSSFQYSGVTIGADGDVWLSTPGTFATGATFSRFDALGNYKSQVTVGKRTFWLTTAQSGEIFFMAQDSGDVYRLANNTTPIRVITAPSTLRGYGNSSTGMGGVVLDQHGWVYVMQPREGKLLVFNPQYQLVQDPLAQVLDSLGWKPQRTGQPTPAWMRNADGMMTSRLLVSRAPQDDTGPGIREILEINPRGMGAPGADPTLVIKRRSPRAPAVSLTYTDTLRLADGSSATWSFLTGQLPDGLSLSSSGVLSGTPTRKGTFDFAVKAVSGVRAGFARFTVTVGDAPPVEVAEQDVANALMGGAALPAATVQYLDNLGNKNGRLDVGDFRAFLRSQGQLSGAPKP
ncbi:MAG TPA: putative Ig domain-containing protein, partial [Gemmatimonadales bacterium]|nr:putative Ig domain-containing protein [Gemmatimonadales bacterium]